MLFCLTAVDMLLTRRIVWKCSRFVRQFYVINSLAEQSSSVVVHRGKHMTSYRNMASNIESDIAQQKDDIPKSTEDGDCQTSAKRLKISDSSLENDVSDISSKFLNIIASCVFYSSL